MTRPYRDCVVAVIRNAEGLLLTGERSNQRGVWQLPQGGVDGGESAEQALLRELREEIGTDRVIILEKLPRLISYDFPVDMETGPAKFFRGQQQTWFLVELLPDGRPSIELSDGEFADLKWMASEDLLRGVVSWKQKAYYEGLNGFRLI